MNISGLSAHQALQGTQAQSRSAGTVPDGDGDHGREPTTTTRNAAYSVHLSPQAQALLAAKAKG